MDILNIPYIQERNGHYLKQIGLTVDSEAFAMPINNIVGTYIPITALLSSVVGGTAKVQYSLAPKPQVLDDSALWHDWSLGDVSDTGGTSFDSPITFVRVIAGSGVTYNLEILI